MSGQEFMNKTKYKNMSMSDQDKRLPRPPLEKEYDNSGIINLKKPIADKEHDNNLLDLITDRTSVRSYDDSAISPDELSYFLWCTQGIKSKKENSYTFRTVPSAGARHAFETYLLINNVANIQKGLYRYIASKHAIIPISLDNNISDALTAACLGQGMVKTSAITFFWAADIYRMQHRYGERGYRYIHLDAGHVCQNLYLAAENKSCGVCAIAAFDDDETNSVLGLDGINDFVVYIATLGKKK